MPKSLVEKTCLKIPIAVLHCTPVGLFAYLVTAHRVCNIRSWLVCKPCQAPHQLAKRPITHVFVLVKFPELQTSRNRDISSRPNTKPRRGGFSETLLRNRQSSRILIPQETATNIPPQLAQVVDRDKAVQMFTDLIASTL